MVFKGTAVAQDSGRAVVTATGMATESGGIANLLDATVEQPSASVIASDKTGTLTRNEMTIQRVVSASGSTHITGVGYAPVGRVECADAELAASPLRDEQTVVLSGGSLTQSITGSNP